MLFPFYAGFHPGSEWSHAVKSINWLPVSIACASELIRMSDIKEPYSLSA